MIRGRTTFILWRFAVSNGKTDEISNVYNMGAIAFVLLADGGRSPEEWRLNQDLYEVALKAVSEKRSERQQSIEEFITEWMSVK